MPVTAEAIRALEEMRIVREIELAVHETYEQTKYRYIPRRVNGTLCVHDRVKGVDHVFCEHPFIITEEALRQIKRQVEGE